jgi:hypothetical protein
VGVARVVSKFCVREACAACPACPLVLVNRLFGARNDAWHRTLHQTRDKRKSESEKHVKCRDARSRAVGWQPETGCNTRNAEDAAEPESEDRPRSYLYKIRKDEEVAAAMLAANNGPRNQERGSLSCCFGKYDGARGPQQTDKERPSSSCRVTPSVGMSVNVSRPRVSY